MSAVISHARTAGYSSLEWQTPAWNEHAIRFYSRTGAAAQDKRRFTLEV